MFSAAVQTSCQNVSRDFDAKMTRGDSWKKAYRFIYGFYIVFSKDGSQHYVSIQSSSGDNRLVKVNDGLRLVCRGAKFSTKGWGLSVGRAFVSFFLLSKLKIVVQRLGISEPFLMSIAEHKGKGVYK